MITKKYIKMKVKNGYRYFTKRYLKEIIQYGKCKIYNDGSFINILWKYKNEFIPLMESNGWKREEVNISNDLVIL